MKIKTRIDNSMLSGSVLTEDAVRGLVGQTPRLLAETGNYEAVLGRSTVVAAELDGDEIVLTLDVQTTPDRQALVQHMLTPHASMGYSIGGHRIDGDRRLIEDAVAFSIDPAPIPALPLLDRIDGIVHDWEGSGDSASWSATAAARPDRPTRITEPPAGSLVRGADVERLRVAIVECVDAWTLLLRQVAGATTRRLRRVMGR